MAKLEDDYLLPIYSLPFCKWRRNKCDDLHACAVTADTVDNDALTTTADTNASNGVESDPTHQSLLGGHDCWASLCS
ncbi:unnamed protein product [Hydatigera taeniaeformis]|uniref:Uncharacterized protein n=1 Tax=Hydatigena taeniaeformis TaxID=6205 RepID=A0A0R3XDD9_HYDTA|nr:unnamed protein product [Hydatigera taeniaeformis]